MDILFSTFEILQTPNIMNKLMVVLLLSILNFINAQNVLGDWNGALEIQDIQLRLVFHNLRSM